MRTTVLVLVCKAHAIVQSFLPVCARNQRRTRVTLRAEFSPLEINACNSASSPLLNVILQTFFMPRFYLCLGYSRMSLH